MDRPICVVAGLHLFAANPEVSKHREPAQGRLSHLPLPPSAGVAGAAGTVCSTPSPARVRTPAAPATPAQARCRSGLRPCFFLFLSPSYGASSPQRRWTWMRPSSTEAVPVDCIVASSSPPRAAGGAGGFNLHQASPTALLHSVTLPSDWSWLARQPSTSSQREARRRWAQDAVASLHLSVHEYIAPTRRADVHWLYIMNQASVLLFPPQTADWPPTPHANVCCISIPNAWADRYKECASSLQPLHLHIGKSIPPSICCKQANCRDTLSFEFQYPTLSCMSGSALWCYGWPQTQCCMRLSLTNQ